ncbi:MAG TPA: hypothetical protein VF061_11460 [Gemmatimonadales bacterium]
MSAREHSVVREGTVTGLLGAVIVAAWYFVFDMAQGRPFRTPNVLGKLFFRGDLQPGAREIVPEIVAGFTLLHLLMFALVGMGLTLLIHLATRNLGLRMGVWIGLVVAFCFFAGLTYMAHTATDERVPLWSVVGGTLTSVVAMAWYLVRRHPGIRSEAQLGDEVRSPPHPPGSPRA